MNGRGTKTQPHAVPPRSGNGAATRAAEPVAATVAVAERDDAPRQERAPLSTRFGWFGAVAKRFVARLIRFYTYHQDAVNAELAERIRALETGTSREIAAVRRDVTGAALDFGAIAGRMRVFENVRRVVERSAAYRYEVRAHRSALVELRAHVGALSARLTHVQRETAPTREQLRKVSAHVDALAESSLRVADELSRLAAAAERQAQAAVEAGRRATRIERAAAARASEIERAAAERADALERDVHDQAAMQHAAAERIAHVERTADERVAGLERTVDERIAHVERTAEEHAAAQHAAAEEHAAVQHAAAEGVAQRFAGLDAIVEQARAESAARGDALTEADRIAREAQTLAAALRDEIAQLRAAVHALEPVAKAVDVDAIREQLDAAGRDVAALRARLLATPYMSAPMESWPLARRSTAEDFDYVGFEDVFRGPETFIRERLRAYLPLLDGCASVIELGSGRGEFLQLMREHRIAATGVDLNADAVARARAHGLENVVQADAVAYLEGVAEGSAGAIFSAQFAEHLPFRELLRCLELARTRLVPGGLFIAETINPNSIEGAKTFYVDPSHVKPLFPEVFAFLCRSIGFPEVRLFYPNGGGFDETSPTSQHEYAVVATAPSTPG